MMKTFKFITLSAIFIFGMIMPVHTQEKGPEQVLQQLYASEGERYFRFQPGDPSLINEISKIISIDKVGTDQWVLAYANKKEFSRFLEYHLDYEMLPHPGDYEGPLNMKSTVAIREIEEWDFYPTYDAYVDMMFQFAEQYPSLCQVFSIGNSVQNRQLLMAKISDNVGIRENEPQFLYTSTIHGDETTGYVLLLRMIDYLLSNYGSDPKVTNLVNNIEIWINPLANPDGTYAGGNNTVNNARRYNALWIDLNRNFPDPADGPHPDGNEWQAETVAFMEMAEDNRFVLSSNIHGGTEVCNYPWDTWSRLSADDAWWQFVCHEYADTAQYYSPAGYMTGYDDGITNGYAWYRITGGRQDYMNYFHQAREFTLEISDTKLLPPSQLPAWWDYNYRSLLNYMEQSLYGLRGTVKDSVTGWPVRAEVYAVLHEKDSSWVYSALPNGNYHRLLPAGNYSIRYSAPGYLTQIHNNVVVNNHQTTVLDIRLVPEGVGGIEQNLVSESIHIYPNPTDGRTVHFDSPAVIFQIQLTDMAGKQVKSFQVNAVSGSIDLQPAKKGIYFLDFMTENGRGIKRLFLN